MPLHNQGKSGWYPLDRLGGPQSQSRYGGEEKNSQLLLELKPPIIQPVAQHYTTQLSWLLIHFNVQIVILDMLMFATENNLFCGTSKILSCHDFSAISSNLGTILDAGLFFSST
jgi:hypothetical protein